MARGGLKRLATALERNVSRALYTAGEYVADAAKDSIIRGSVTGKGHVASKPGEPPNANYRTLDGNIEAVQVGPFKVEVSSNAPYSIHLEYGTSRMAARPFMGPAIAQSREQVENIINSAVSEAVKSAGS